ncbi:MAG: BlaI/MecI/CopY family transcriptional regulator [Clostridia bacterium]|nr:BlaI/MecI/CopY family transcriptional regulator [Clostridia bacterium]
MKFEKLSDSEMTVLNALWQYDHPVRPSELMNTIENGWAISTVKTLLDRLVKKRVVKMEYVKRFRYFSPLCSKEEFFRENVGGIKNSIRGFSPISQIASFIDSDDVTEEDLDELEALLREARERVSKKDS